MNASVKCENLQPKVSEFANGTLPSQQVWEVQNHLATCQSCSKFVQDIQAMGQMLRALPLRQTSDQFEAKLAERLAAVKKPSSRGLFGRIPKLHFRVLAPSLAFGTAAVALICVTVQHFIVPTPGVKAYPHVATPQAEAKLAAYCVDQHRSYVTQQPLSDWSAQNLATHLDNPNETAASVAANDNEGSL